METLEEFNKRQAQKYRLTRYRLNNIICPKCGRELYDDTNIMLASHPPQIPIMCFYCDYKGSRIA